MGLEDRMTRTTQMLGGLALVVACALASGCQTVADMAGAQVSLEVPPPDQPAWTGIVVTDDADRLGRTAQAWDEGLDRARRGRFGRRITAEGPLLDPDAALPRATPPPGSYRCRLLRLGQSGARRRAFTALGPFFCYVGVEGDLLAFTQQTGPARPGGYLWEDSGTRLAFVGSTAIGRDALPPAYRAMPERDVVGWVERVGAFRYRLVMPWPTGGGAIDILELIPDVRGG